MMYYKEKTPFQRWYPKHAESLQDGKIDTTIRTPGSPRQMMVWHSKQQAMRKRMRSHVTNVEKQGTTPMSVMN